MSRNKPQDDVPAQTLSPGFFDPITDKTTSLQVTVPDVPDVMSPPKITPSRTPPSPTVESQTVVTRFMAIFFPTEKCACSVGKAKGPFEKIYTY